MKWMAQGLLIYMHSGARITKTGRKLEVHELEPRAQKTGRNATSLKGNERATDKGTCVT